ncbi:hypothetical protein AB0B89_29315 [Sphaerisporangium sp. NPDC049002]|uniref:hypothetical protein n=1 Tax=Sphaerisporangium sp. NPDC049002 TaxID=3155392 RepID=UPI0033FC677C
MAYIEDRVSTVESDIAEIKEVLAGHTRSLTALERNLSLVRDDVAELKAGQIEIRDLLARVVARLEGVQA